MIFGGFPALLVYNRLYAISYGVDMVIVTVDRLIDVFACLSVFLPGVVFKLLYRFCAAFIYYDIAPLHSVNSVLHAVRAFYTCYDSFYPEISQFCYRFRFCAICYYLFLSLLLLFLLL